MYLLKNDSKFPFNYSLSFLLTSEKIVVRNFYLHYYNHHYVFVYVLFFKKLINI